MLSVMPRIAATSVASLQMSAGVTSTAALSPVPRWFIGTLLITCAWHVTLVASAASHMVTCDGSGLTVVIYDINENYFQGAPYVQGKPSCDVTCVNNRGIFQLRALLYYKLQALHKVRIHVL